MYLLECNNHKALRTKNVTYSESVRFFLLPCPSHCLSLLLSDSYKAERMQLPAYIGRVSTSLQPITATGFALNVQQEHLPLLPQLLQNTLRKESSPKGSGIWPRNGPCLGELCGAVCFPPGAPFTSSSAVSVWSHAARLCCTLRDISAEAAAVKASALIHFCEILLPGKKHGYGWSTSQVTAGSEQVYSCGINIPR